MKYPRMQFHALTALTFTLVLFLSACDGDDDDREASGDASGGAPDSILGYKVVMTVEEVEVVEESPTVNLLVPGDTMTLQFIDENTISGESKFREIAHSSWDYAANREEAELNLYTSGGEVHLDFEFESDTSGAFEYDGELYMSGARTRYYGDFVISSIEPDAGTDPEEPSSTDSTDSSLIQGRWASECDYGYEDIFEFSGNELNVSHAIYETDYCTGTPSATAEAVSATYYLGSEITTNSGLSAHEINITYTSSSHEDYEVSAGDEHFSIVHISGGSLYFGDLDTGSGASSSSRPTDLDFESSYTKK